VFDDNNMISLAALQVIVTYTLPLKQDDMLQIKIGKWS
jgi:hypothetical protein